MEYKFKGDIKMRLDLAENDNIQKTLRKQIDNFLERNLSQLVGKNPDFIIEKWLEWQFSRYAVDEQEDAFYINDLKEQQVVACITKKDPQAYYHAYKIRDDLNRLDCKCTITVDDETFIVSGNAAIDQIIRDIECSNSSDYTIDDVINDVVKGDEEE